LSHDLSIGDREVLNLLLSLCLDLSMFLSPVIKVCAPTLGAYRLTIVIFS
jgi:hypothetical protein